MPRRQHASKKLKVLVEMRPALEGYAGIPQEVRLLFRGLSQIECLSVEGMLQTSRRTLSKGMTARGLSNPRLHAAYKMNRYSNVVISMAESPYRNVFDIISGLFKKRMQSLLLTIMMVLQIGKVRLTIFESEFFPDFTWRTLFSKTLPASDYAKVSRSGHRVCSIPWDTMHSAGLASLNWRRYPLYPRLLTPDFDVLISQTPYPARLSGHTKMVVRYHDAIPVLMPHTIPNKSLHQATHFYALQSNVRSGAWFACVSEATRQDLLKLFPDVEDRAVTIHNMVSHSYYLEDSDPEMVPGIIRARLHEGDKSKSVEATPSFLTNSEREAFYRRHLFSMQFDYLLIVSTVEPRKNHARLLAAWEAVRSSHPRSLKLVVVGGLGWDYGPIMRAFGSWIERGELFMLSAVPSSDLRILYRHSLATICPSLSEGFDFSGVEAMQSGGIVIASDIPVHREVYDDAATYFDPYSTKSLIDQIKATLYDEGADKRIDALRARGQHVSARYLPEVILPKWEDFLSRVAAA